MKKIANMRRFLFFFAISASIMSGQNLFSATPVVGDYTYIPPFLGVSANPNILLILDNSGSMSTCAYPHPKTVGSTGCTRLLDGNGSSPYGYDKTKQYSGYFEEDMCYEYFRDPNTSTFLATIRQAQSRFQFPVQKAVGASCSADKPWDGTFLNWLTMRRIDIAKKVLTGGMCSTTRTGDGTTCKMLQGQVLGTFSGVGLLHKRADLTGVSPYTGVRCILVGNGFFSVYDSPTFGEKNSRNMCTGKSIAGFRIRVVTGDNNQSGVIQEIGNRARFGLMQFNTSDEGGKVVKTVGDSIINIVNEIDGVVPSTLTPLAESLYEAARYFAQIEPGFGPANGDYAVGLASDPYRQNNEWIRCCQSFVLLFTDGQPTSDITIPKPLQDIPNTGMAHKMAEHNKTGHDDLCSSYYGGCGFLSSHFLDEVAYWAHTTDLRPDVAGDKIDVLAETSTKNEGGNLDGKQTLNIYTFLAFEKGDGPNILKDAAKVGGFIDENEDGKINAESDWDAKINMDEPFEDKNDNKKYDVNEPYTDSNKNGQYNFARDPVPDGVPDTYFSGGDAYSMRKNMLAAFNDMIQKSAAGTALSFLASSSTGEGAIYQSYFSPQSEDASAISWVGHIQALFLDNHGNIREDTDGSGSLTLSDDKIVRTSFDTVLNRTVIQRCSSDKSGQIATSTCSNPNENLTLQDLSPLWDGGKLLAKRSASDRKIWTWIDGLDPDGKVDSSEVILFDESNTGKLEPYLATGNSDISRKTIQFIRGEPVQNFRNREGKVEVNATSANTWKLGDIINSDPISVSSPKELFNLHYKDATYPEFLKKYKQRRHMIYVGANDGMLHAFNGGFFHAGDDISTKDDPVTAKDEGKKEYGYFTTKYEGEGPTTEDYPLGREMWGFIPQELLPHLQWITDANYDKRKHVFYVDGSPRVTDARIFKADDIHPNGWGTILIASMRMGGGLFPVDLNNNGTTTDKGEDRFRSAYFAFDITDPEQDFNKNGNKFMWSFQDDDLGFTTSWPAIVRTHKGDNITDANTDKWYAVVGSGPLSYEGERYASSTNKKNRFSSTTSEYGHVFFIDLENGTLAGKRKIGTERYAFMGDPIAVDLMKDYRVDGIYIGNNYIDNLATSSDVPPIWGEKRGKLYRILTDIEQKYGGKPENYNQPGEWKDSVVVDAARPVLVQPTVTKDENGDPWVLFGTGRLFSAGLNSDHRDKSVQALYGVREAHKNGCWDKDKDEWKLSSACNTAAGTDFFQTKDIAVSNTAISRGNCDIDCNDEKEGNGKAFDIPQMLEDKDKGGWVFELRPGERMLSRITLLAGAVTVPTYLPTVQGDVCKVEGKSTLYALSYNTGAAFFSLKNEIGAFGLLNPNNNIPHQDSFYDKNGVKVGANADGSNVGTILNNIDLGSGIASEVVLVANEGTVTGKAQTSTGNIVQMVINLNPRKEGSKLFLEKTE